MLTVPLHNYTAPDTAEAPPVPCAASKLTQVDNLAHLRQARAGTLLTLDVPGGS